MLRLSTDMKKENGTLILTLSVRLLKKLVWNSNGWFLAVTQCRIEFLNKDLQKKRPCLRNYAR